MSEWREFTIGDIAEVFDGPHATPKKVNHGPWFLSISSLRSGRLVLSESAHVNEEDFTKWTRRVTPQPGDVLFSYETRLGEAALMPQGIRACLGRRMGLLRPKKEVVDSRFLLLAYLSPRFQETINSRKVPGATVDRIPLVDLPGWPIHLPTMTEQQSIAEALGALDDKIAVNERITALYGEILQTQFDRIINADEQGQVSDLPATELVDFNPKTGKPSEENAVYVDMAALPTDRAPISSWSHRKPKSGSRFINGDTLLARITPCLENGKTGYVDFMEDGQIGMGSTEFIVLRSHPEVPQEFSYFLARNKKFRNHAIQKMAGTSGRQRVNAKDASNFLIRKPTKEELNSFGEQSSKAFAHIRSLTAESRTLASLRDTLLPQLMSGKLRIKDAETIVEDRV
ncbi:restriction endonuclease subunit S [Nocardiopsis sp. LOL_012]|uniref:restriction endonuclease subunit S n=1 Tax=Nocardiopsis sp. LOL_012 TaxID=3345409 RepID=UPI003A8B9D94